MRTDSTRRARRALEAFTLGAAALLAACSSDDPSRLRNGPADGASQGQAPVSTPPLGQESDLPLPRLTRDEYVATITDVVSEALPTSRSDVLSAATALAQTMPVDQLVSPPTEKHGGFSRVDQAVQQEYADVPFQVAALLGKSMTSTPARLGELLGACAQGGTSVDHACLEGFVRRFGEAALRHPLADDDVAFYVSGAPATNVTADVVATIVTRLLSAPRFLYHVESGVDASAAPDIFALDAWELASRLSYHLWGTMPDPALREAARSGALLTNDGYAAQVDRLFADPRATATFATFFTQWFWPLLALPALDGRLGDATFKAFAGADAPSSELRGRMVREVVDAATYIAAHDGTIADLLSNRQSFARDADLAAIYKVAPWDGVAPPPELPPERGGLLTRAAFLTTGTANTRPIMKGVFIRSTLLCDALPTPPAAAMNTVISLSPTSSTRQVVEQLTEANPACAGCHKATLNPLGFATESFDSLGRARATQTLFDTTGKVVGHAPIDTSSVPRINPGDERVSKGIADVTQWLIESGRVETCFATRYFRFTFRRLETTDGDNALIAVLAKAAQEGKTLKDALKATALRPEFKRRRIVR
jgi:hypothetical protein